MFVLWPFNVHGLYAYLNILLKSKSWNMSLVSYVSKQVIWTQEARARVRRMETRNAASGGSGLDLYVELLVPCGRGERVFLRGLRKWRDARSGTGSGSGSVPGMSATLGQGPLDSGSQLRLFRAEDEVVYMILIYYYTIQHTYSYKDYAHVTIICL